MSDGAFGPLPAQVIQQLPTPELAIELLKALAKSTGELNLNGTLRSAEQYGDAGGVDSGLLLARLADAWTWLQAQGLIGMSERNAPSSYWMRLTQEGRVAASNAEPLPQLWASQLLAGNLDERIARKVRPIFNLGDFETAAFAAMKEVEVEVRRLAGFDDSVIGTRLMRSAFKEGGPLADASADKGEQVALMELFAGAIGAFKNPSSHRTVHFNDPVEAAEVVQTADLLMRLLRRVEQRLRPSSAT